MKTSVLFASDILSMIVSTNLMKHSYKKIWERTNIKFIITYLNHTLPDSRSFKTLNRVALNNTYFFIFSSGTTYLVLLCEQYMKTKETSIWIFYWIFIQCCWAQEYGIVKMNYLHPFMGRANADTFLKALTNIKIKTWHLVEEYLLGNC